MLQRLQNATRTSQNQISNKSLSPLRKPSRLDEHGLQSVRSVRYTEQCSPESATNHRRPQPQHSPKD